SASKGADRNAAAVRGGQAAVRCGLAQPSAGLNQYSKRHCERSEAISARLSTSLNKIASSPPAPRNDTEPTRSKSSICRLHFQRTSKPSVQQPRDVFRDDPGGWAVNAFGEKAGAVRGFEIEFDRVGAGAARFFGKARRRLDSAGRVNRNEYFALGERLIDLV